MTLQSLKRPPSRHRPACFSFATLLLARLETISYGQRTEKVTRSMLMDRRSSNNRDNRLLHKRPRMIQFVQSKLRMLDSDDGISWY